MTPTEQNCPDPRRRPKLTADEQASPPEPCQTAMRRQGVRPRVGRPARDFDRQLEHVRELVALTKMNGDLAPDQRKALRELVTVIAALIGEPVE